MPLMAVVQIPVYATTMQRAIVLGGGGSRDQSPSDRAQLRPSLTQLLRSGHDMRTVQELWGHVGVTTTLVFLRVLDRGPEVRSPLDPARISRASLTRPRLRLTVLISISHAAINRRRQLCPQSSNEVLTGTYRCLVACLRWGYAALESLDKANDTAGCVLIEFADNSR